MILSSSPLKLEATLKTFTYYIILAGCRLRIIIVIFDLFCKTVAHCSIFGLYIFAYSFKGRRSLAYHYYLTIQLKKRCR